MKFKNILILLLVGSLFLGMGGTVFAKIYVIGTCADFPPFEYVENGEFAGFDLDLIRAIAEVQGLDIEIKDLSFDSLIAALKSDNIDLVISGMTITEEREKTVDFSKPYYTADQSIIVKEDSDDDLTVLFGDHNIGVQTSTTGDLWVTDQVKKKGILTGKIVRYDTFILAVTDLINENLAAIVLDMPVAERFIKIRPVKLVGVIVTGEEYGIAVNEGNSELLKLINEGMDKVKVSGKMDEIIAKYFK